MKSLINKLFGNSKNVEGKSDLTPTKIRTIKSETHGTHEDFNNTWKHIYLQTRNYDKFEKDYGIKIK